MGVWLDFGLLLEAMALPFSRKKQQAGPFPSPELPHFPSHILRFCHIRAPKKKKRYISHFAPTTTVLRTDISHAIKKNPFASGGGKGKRLNYSGGDNPTLHSEVDRVSKNKERSPAAANFKDILSPNEVERDIIIVFEALLDTRCLRRGRPWGVPPLPRPPRPPRSPRPPSSWC